jgi:anti-anti-sigma factor
MSRPAPDSTLGLRVLDCDESALVAVSGELDIATSGLLQGLLDDLLRARRTPRIDRLVLDMRDVTFVDAGGIAPALHARAVLAKRGGTMEIRRASSAVRRLLTLLDLDALAAATTIEGHPSGSAV